jgi:ParB family chromosome partitioning protein
MTLLTVPLSQLKPSKHNARKTGGQSIDDLAASIRAHGLLQNLTVIESGKGYEVVAGGRRLAALKQLSKAKALPGDYAVPCLLVANAAAAEASLAENAVREAMHPADQFEAFRQLIDGGKSITDTAAAFGVTETVVRQRLKLANVSPRLLVEYRAGNATLEQMQALAIVDDHAAQEAAWGDDEAEGYGSYHRQPQYLRRVLTETEVSSTDDRAVFVGLEAYEKAGGVVRRDLFGEKVYLTDAALLDRLVIEKLEAVGEAYRADGWSWVECRPKLSWSDRQQFSEAGKPKRRALTEAEQAEYAALEARYDELDEMLEDADPEEVSAEIADHAGLRDQLRAMNASREVWPEKIKAKAGVLIYLDDDGVNIERGLLKPGERLGESKGGDGGDIEVEQPKPKKDPGELSQSAEERLHGEVTAIIRFKIEDREALAALAAELLDSRSTPVRISKYHEYLPGPTADALNSHALTKQRDAEVEKFSEHVKSEAEQAGGVYAWLLTQPEFVTHQVLAVCAANNILAKHGGAEFALQAGVNIADHWTVTEEWLAQQPKGYILAALAEAQITIMAPTKCKAAELAALAAPELAKVGWLPKPLRFEGGAA